MRSLRDDTNEIIQRTIGDVMPDRAVQSTLASLRLSGRLYVAAIGKAAWVMAKAAADSLGTQIVKGIIVTKYGHSRGPLDGFEVIEAGHPTPDDNSVLGAKKVIGLIGQALPQDTVLFLLSGGGSSLLELPAPGLTMADIQSVNRQLLCSGAGITQINVIRKKLSAIKGGKLALYLKGARACAIILSDVVGDRQDMIASGLTYPDTATAQEAWDIVEKYHLKLEERVSQTLFADNPAGASGFVENYVVGSVENLCRAAACHAGELGYHPYILTTTLQNEARQAGSWLASLAQSRAYEKPFALIAGGETVVRVKGKGLGGRNQELALSAAQLLAGQKNVLLFSLGSDGTDGPTDAAGGIVDGETMARLEQRGISLQQALDENNSYHALKAVDGLIFTGATGTNVNDVSVLLCR
ncbi:MAG: DUF4147 domain-containing protein [Eubacteriales bacterium]|nr:DUF4147 domain-containing protein [Eubacteriales bacterium]